MIRDFGRQAAFLGAVCLLLSGCSGEGGIGQTAETTGQGRPGQEEQTEKGGLIKVGFSQLGEESDWRIACTESIKSALTEANGFDLLFDDAQQKQENQLKAIRNFILQDADYIVLSPLVESGWDSALEEAKKAKIPVITSDRMVDAPKDLYTCFVGADFVKEGERCGRWLEDCLEKQGRADEDIRIVTLEGTVGSSPQLGRTEGFANIMKAHPNWHMIAEENGDFTLAKGKEVMEQYLNRYKNIDVVVSQNDNMTFGAIDAIQEAGKTCGPDGEMIILSFDAVSAAFDAMIDGDLNADFECNPLHGPRVSETIRKLENGEKVAREQYVDETYFDTTMDLKQIKADREY